MDRRTASRRWAARIAGSLLLAVVMAPISFFVTILLLPLWRFVESELGIEAVGHSGPAEWCFSLVYAVLAILCLVAWWRRPRTR